MINDVVRLVDEEENLIGIRIRLVNGIRYDMALDEFHAYMVADLDSLDELEMFEDENGVFVTHEESMDGVQISEITASDRDTLNALVGYFNKFPDFRLVDTTLSNDDYLKARSIGIDKLRPDFSGKVPYPMLTDVCAYAYDNFQGNKGIYEKFNQTQREAFTAYSKYRTRQIFLEVTGNLDLPVNPQRDVKLVEIMGSADDWEFAGVVDRGAPVSFCELGHRIRYEFYAVSQKVGKSVIFGSDCVQSFFSLPPKTVTLLKKIQADILAEAKITAYLLASKRNMDTENSMYVEKFLKHLAQSYTGMHRKVYVPGMIQSIRNFRKVNLPLTTYQLYWLNSMKQTTEILENKLKAESSVMDTITELGKRGLPYEVTNLIFSMKEDNLLKYEVRQLLLNGDTGHLLVKKFYDFYDLYVDIEFHVKKALNCHPSQVHKILDRKERYVKDGNIIRLMASEDISKGLREKLNPVIGEGARNLLIAIDSLFRDLDEVRKRVNLLSSGEINLERLNFIMKALEYVERNKGYLATKDFMEETAYAKAGCPVLSTREEAMQYHHTILSEEMSNDTREEVDSLDEIKGDRRTTTLLHIAELIKNYGRESGTKINSFAFKVADTVIGSKRVSDKQEPYLRDAFDSLTKFILDYKADLPSTNKSVDIIETYVKFRTLSEKQVIHIKSALSILLEDDDDIPF